MVDVNLMGPIHVIETFLPPMVAAGRGGHLVNVSSAAGIVALPWHAAYSASKYGLRGLSEVLRFDLARHRIGVSVVVPGAVKTGLVQTVQIAGVDREDPQVAKWVDRFGGHAISPEAAAEKILAGVRRNRYMIYTSPDIRALYAFKRVAWWPYSVAMRQVNVLFTRALRPTSQGSAAWRTRPGRGHRPWRRRELRGTRRSGFRGGGWRGGGQSSTGATVEVSAGSEPLAQPDSAKRHGDGAQDALAHGCRW